MSGNANSKKLAKRSIVGTRIAVPSSNHDGRLLPGVIVAMKTPGSDSGGNDSVEPLGPPRPRLMTPSAEDMAAVKYSVRFDYDKSVVKEFSENEIIGPGFSSVTSSKLKHDQTVYVTHNNREFQGVVRYHRPNIDQVIIQLVSPSALHIRTQKAFWVRFDVHNIALRHVMIARHCRAIQSTVTTVLHIKTADIMLLLLLLPPLTVYLVKYVSYI